MSTQAVREGGAVRRTATISFYVLLAAEIAWIFSLPVFPSKTARCTCISHRIISRLLSGASLYSKYFYIQHILPPYSLHYYFLVAAMKVFSPRVAEKLLVGGASILLALGFRFFTKTLGDRTGVASLAVLPLLLHQALLMGFYNYSLALGIGLWASAFWVRASRDRHVRDWLIFLALTYIVLLSHPVPLALLLTFAGIDLLSRVLRDRLRSGEFPKAESIDRKQYRAEVLFLSLAALSSLYVAAFIKGTESRGNVLPARTIHEAILRIVKVECSVRNICRPWNRDTPLSCRFVCSDWRQRVAWEPGVRGTDSEKGMDTCRPALGSRRLDDFVVSMDPIHDQRCGLLCRSANGGSLACLCSLRSWSEDDAAERTDRNWSACVAHAVHPMLGAGQNCSCCAEPRRN